MKSCSAICRQPAFYLKLIEFGLCFIGLFLIKRRDILKEFYYSYTIEMLNVIVTAGYCLILFAFLISYVVDETQYFLEIFLFGVGSVLNFIVGSFILKEFVYKHHHQSETVVIVMYMCHFLCGSFMFVDFLRQVRFGNINEEEDFYNYNY